MPEHFFGFFQRKCDLHFTKSAENIFLPDGLVFSLVCPVFRPVCRQRNQRNILIERFRHCGRQIECGCSRSADQCHGLLHGLSQAKGKITGAPFVNNTPAIELPAVDKRVHQRPVARARGNDNIFDALGMKNSGKPANMFFV